MSQVPVEQLVTLVRQSEQVIGLHTIIRNAECSREDFIFYSDRLIRLLIEEALNLLPLEESKVVTPSGETFVGVKSTSNICGVSIVRAGESMENGLRAVCKAARIGKILIQLPQDLHKRHVLLLDPMLATGGSAAKSIELLIERGVKEERITFLTLIAAPDGIRNIKSQFPKLTIVTTAVDQGLNDRKFIVPGIGDFSDQYFGTTST